MDITPSPAEPTEAVATPFISTDAIKAKILSWNWQNVQFALKQTAELYADIEVADQEYMYSKRLSRSSAGTAANKQTDKEVDVAEAANQCDIVGANFMENLGNDRFHAVAQGGESQERADITKQVMDNAFDEAGCRKQDELLMQRYVRYPAAGCKVCIEYKEDTELERIPVLKTPDALMQFYVESAQMNAPVREIGDADTDPEMGIATSTLFERPRTVGRYRYYYKAIDPRNFAFGDLYTFYKTQTVHTQPHVHEFHYWTKEAMRNYGGFKDIDKLGTPNATDRRHPQQAGQDTATATAMATSPNFPLYEIVDSWSENPFMDWLEKGEVSVDELTALAEEFGFSPQEFNIPQKWCVTHKEDKVILQLIPNYKKKKLEYPYHFTSFFGGQSYLQRILGPCQAIRALRNLHLQNIKIKVKQPIILDRNSQISVDDIKRLHYEDGAVVEAEIGSRPIADQVLFYGQMVDDMTQSAMAGIGLLKGDIASFGTPPIMAGNGNADTATQDAINNSRGQQKLNEPFERVVDDVLVRCWEDCRDLIFLNYTEAQYIQVAGEDGVQMARTKWVTPEQISNRFKIIPTASYDFADRNAKAQQLIAMMNIVGGTGMISPETLMKMAAGVYEYMGFSRQEINEWTNNQGLGTDPMEEIRVMVENPQQLITVRPDDPHMVCLFLAMQAAQAMPFLGQQWNFQQYIQMHQLYMQMQMAAQQQEQQAAGGEGKDGKPKGPPKQPNPNPPTSQEGTEARQPGQWNSAPDGGMSAIGMTGQGGMAAMGGHLPNSISAMIGVGA